MNSTSLEIRRLNMKSYFNRRGLWRCYCCRLSYFLLFTLFGQRASACTFDHLFVRLPSLCLEVCLSFVIELSKHFSALPFIQLLLFEQDTSVFYLSFEMYYNIPRVEAPLLVIKISKKTSSQSWRLNFALKQNETAHKLILHENIHATRE